MPVSRHSEKLRQESGKFEPVWTIWQDPIPKLKKKKELRGWLSVLGSIPNSIKKIRMEKNTHIMLEELNGSECYKIKHKYFSFHSLQSHTKPLSLKVTMVKISYCFI